MHRVSICCNPHHCRDIATKNVLLSADNVAKVANIEFAVKTRGNVPKSPILSPMLPIQWKAPEAIELRVRIPNFMHMFT